MLSRALRVAEPAGGGRGGGRRRRVPGGLVAVSGLAVQRAAPTRAGTRVPLPALPGRSTTH